MTQKGVMIIVYKIKNAPRYILLKRNKNWEGWETPKGRLEENDYVETVRREIAEETGIGEEQTIELKDLDKEVSWSYERDEEKREKHYKCFLVKVEEDAHVDVSQNPDDEHEHGFFFSFRDAKDLLTHDNNRELLLKAHEKITC